MTTHRVDLTGDYKTTIYAAARRLLAGGAGPTDTVETWRDGKLSMAAVVGGSAMLACKENKHGNPSLQPVRWKAFLTDMVASRTAETAWKAQFGRLFQRLGLERKAQDVTPSGLGRQDHCQCLRKGRETGAPFDCGCPDRQHKIAASRSRRRFYARVTGYL